KKSLVRPQLKPRDGQEKIGQEHSKKVKPMTHARRDRLHNRRGVLHPYHFAGLIFRAQMEGLEGFLPGWTQPHLAADRLITIRDEHLDRAFRGSGCGREPRRTGSGWI